MRPGSSGFPPLPRIQFVEEPPNEEEEEKGCLFTFVFLFSEPFEHFIYTCLFKWYDMHVL